jgi:PAS domain S-box-containing protein
MIGTHQDITKRKQLDENLRKSESVYRLLFVASQEGIAILDAETAKIIDANPSLQRLSGLSLEELRGKEIWEIESFKDIGRQIDFEKLREKEFVRIEPVPIIAKERGSIDVELTSTVYEVSGRKVMQFNIRDITERKRLEEELKKYSLQLEELVAERTGELRESEEKYRELFEASPVSLWEEDFSAVKQYLDELRQKGVPDLGVYLVNNPDEIAKCAGLVKVVKINKATLNLYDAKSVDEVIGGLGSVLTEDSNRAFVSEVVALVQGKKHYAAEFENLTLHGEMKHCNVICTVVPGYEQSLARVLICIVDLTVQKKLEAENRIAKERLDHLIQSNPAVIYSGKPTADLSDFKLTYVSERVVAMLGYEPEELIGHPEFWTNHIHPEDLQPLLERIQNLWKKGQVTFRFRLQNKDGSYRWIRDEVMVVRDVSGKPFEVYGFWIDITESMRLEEENRRLNAEMALRLTEVTDQVESLSRSREKLKTVPDVTSGLDIVLDSILWDFGLDFGAVLVLDGHENRANVRASKGREQAFRLDDSYPLGSFVELEDLQTKSVTKVAREGERSIFGEAVVRIIVPILTGGEVYGLLALGSVKQQTLEPSSTRILELYAELIYSFITEKSTAVIPALETQTLRRSVGAVEPGQMYIVKKHPEKAFKIFASNVFSNHLGLCITRRYPPKVRSEYGLEKTPIVWLTSEASETEKTVQSLQDVSIIIGNFMEKATNPVILLDGFEYLATNSGFDSFLRFLQVINDRLQRKGGVLFAPMLEEAFGPKELALLHRETVNLPE